MDKFREQSVKFGTTIHTETVLSVDLSKRPFRVVSEDREVRLHCLEPAALGNA